MLSFYERDIGLVVKNRMRDSDGLEMVRLGFRQNEEPILILKHDPDAIRPPKDFAGLYHYAMLLPARKDLASTFLSVGNSGALYDGYADHTFSEALYLHDLEDNGIEIYADRPRSAWPDWSSLAQGAYQNFAAMNGPLRIESLLRELSPNERAGPVAFPSGASIGHMHLRVTDLKRSVEFYHEKLGFDVNAYMPEIGAAFLSEGGYHHHLGLNTWHSEGGSRHSQGYAGLEEFRIVLPNADSIEAVATKVPKSRGTGRSLRIEDPDGIPVILELANSRAAS
jgi:catechol 2,3-dioxygenase